MFKSLQLCLLLSLASEDALSWKLEGRGTRDSIALTRQNNLQRHNNKTKDFDDDQQIVP